MKYSTTCSHCESIFLITAEQLEAARGWAQCGVCGAAFNARTTLASENGEPLPVEAVEPTGIEEKPLPESEETTTSTSEAPPAEGALQAELTAEAPLAKQDEEATPVTETAIPELAGIEHRAGGFDLPSIILIDPGSTVFEDLGPLPQIPASAPVPLLPRRRGALETPSTRPEIAFEPQTPFWASKRDLPRRRIKGWVWTVLSLLLLLTLAAQTSYFLRDTIVSHAPQTRPWFEEACATLGCTLSLPKNAKLIQIIGSDLQSEPVGKGHLRLNLTLGNRAPYAQAWPVLVLTLTDHKDRPQARRSFAPSEYLADEKLLESGIPAQSEHPLTLPLDVHDLTLAGYRLEVAY